ncbi:TPM domain-containing protein [Klebsiella spallanzanii]|uniref:TPM domain-containing protein n=1 Tax=Klebsiella spallanzanii TaxID=2587528 RepID=UPI00111ACD72|nr:YgcG family protein [Klebsiella spallanzanii]
MRIIYLLFMLCSFPLFAEQSPIPNLHQQVTDLTGLLTSAEQQALNQRLENLEQKTQVQVAVLVVPGTGEETIEQYATRVFASWKLGDAQRNDGVLLLVAWQDRQVRIEVGYGLEGTLTDVQAGQIIRNMIVPAFKQGELAAGLMQGSEGISTVLTQGELPQGEDATPPAMSLPVPPLFLILIWCCVLYYFIINSEPADLLLLITGACIGGVGLVFLNFPNPWIMMVMTCCFVTPFAIPLLLFVTLPFNQTLRKKFLGGSGHGQSGRGSSGSNSSGNSNSSDGGFSGGGGSSGGGGASGRW